MNLIDILRTVPRSKLGILEVEIYDELAELSTKIDSMAQQGESRIALHKRGIHAYRNGLNRALFGQEAESEGPDYSLGYKTGQRIKAMMRQGGQSLDARMINTYGIFIRLLIGKEGSSGVINHLSEELGVLAQAYNDPYNFLLDAFGRGDKVTMVGEALQRIIFPYKQLVEALSRRRFNESEVKEFESKKDLCFEDHVQLGIIYMCRGEKGKAKRQFMQASLRAAGTELYKPLKGVTDYFSLAYNLFNEAYSKVQLAQQFEMNGKQKK